MIPRVVDFFILRHREISSSDELTLCQSTSRWTGELFRSLSRTVLRQSSIASFTLVRIRITISGTALRAGFVAPKMGNICKFGSASRQIDG